MVTVKRNKVQYLNDTIGSMLVGLTPEERSAIDVRLLFADFDASIHPEWNELWLKKLDWYVSEPRSYGHFTDLSE
jgi:hypothetical protein